MRLCRRGIPAGDGFGGLYGIALRTGQISGGLLRGLQLAIVVGRAPDYPWGALTLALPCLLASIVPAMSASVLSPFDALPRE